jgi:hypothetical protein
MQTKPIRTSRSLIARLRLGSASKPSTQGPSTPRRYYYIEEDFFRRRHIFCNSSRFFLFGKNEDNIRTRIGSRTPTESRNTYKQKL